MAAYEYVTLNGVIVPDTSETKSEVEAEYRADLGDGVDLTDESPNGVLVNAEVKSRNGVATNNANLANQINPKQAGGIFLDAIWGLTSALTGGRKPATSSTFSAPVDLTGVPGTFVPAGPIGVTVNGDEFESVADVTLDGSGAASVDCQSVEKGEIPCAIGELDSLGPGAPLGLETINNTVAATLGTIEESDSVSRLRREDTLALQGISIAEAVTSAISNIDGVKSLSFRENYTKADDTIDGIFLLANSIFVCVDGGADADIAEALLESKTNGANWNGSTSVSVVEPVSGQPYPVKFQRPDPVGVWIRVTIQATTVTNPGGVIDASVLRYANGLLEGERGFVVGASVSPFEIAAAVNIDTPAIFIRQVELSTDGVSYSIAEIPIALDQVARTSASQIITVVA